MGEPPCAKSRERVVFFSPLPIAFNTRVGVISPPGPRGERSGRAAPPARPQVGGLGAKVPSPRLSSPRALSFKGEIRAEGTVPTRAFPCLTPQKRVERVNEVNEEN